MKKITFISVTLCFVLIHSLQAQNCHCEAALRYDIFTASNSELSEYAYVKAIEEDVRRNKTSTTNLSAGILDIFSGKFGEKKANQMVRKYQEFTSNEQNIKTLNTYYAAKTSTPSYDAFTDCLKTCGTSSAFDINFTTTENRVDFLIFYNGNNTTDGSLKITYTYEKDGEIVSKNKRIKRGRLERISVNRPTRTRSFSVSFLAPQLGREGEKTFTITPAILGEIAVRETSTSVVSADPIYHQVKTDNNHNKKFSGQPGYALDSAGKSDGIYRAFSRSLGRKPIRSTEIMIVETADEGYFFTDARVYPVKGPSSGWNDKRGPLRDGFLRKDKNKVIFHAKYWSKPVVLDFYAYRSKLNTIDRTTYYVLQPDHQLTFLTTYNIGVISYALHETAPKHLLLGNGDDRLKFVGKTSNGNNSIFTYTYSPAVD